MNSTPEYKNLNNLLSKLTIHKQLDFKVTDYNKKLAPEIPLGGTRSQLTIKPSALNSEKIDTTKFSSFVKCHAK